MYVCYHYSGYFSQESNGNMKSIKIIFYIDVLFFASSHYFFEIVIPSILILFIVFIANLLAIKVVAGLIKHKSTYNCFSRAYLASISIASVFFDTRPTICYVGTWSFIHNSKCAWALTPMRRDPKENGYHAHGPRKFKLYLVLRLIVD